MLEHQTLNQLPDMYFVNHVFERLDLGKSYEEKLTDKIIPNKFITWKDVNLKGVADYLIMHQKHYLQK